MEKLEKRLRKLFRRLSGKPKRIGADESNPEPAGPSKRGLFGRKRSKSAPKPLSKKPTLLENTMNHPTLVVDSVTEDEIIIVEAAFSESSSTADETTENECSQIPVDSAVSTLSQLATLKLMELGSNVPMRRESHVKDTCVEPVSRDLPPEWMEVPYIDTETVVNVADLPSDYGTEASYTSSLPHLATRRPKKAEDGSESGYMSTMSLSPQDHQQKNAEFRESGYLSTSSLSPRDYSSDEVPSPRAASVRSLKSKYRQHSEKGVAYKERPIPRAVTVDHLDKKNVVDTFLKENIYKTKYVTSVFEAVNGGLEDVVDDVMEEMRRWLRSQKLLAVACEVHFSVPIAKRKRATEYKLKTSLLGLLLDNNQRILNLRCGTDRAPIELIESRTQENIYRNRDYDAIQGVYQRSYHRLLRYAHEETPEWHKPYWNLADSTGIRPEPSRFLFGADPNCLKDTTLVAVNVIGLSIIGNTSKSQPSLA